MPLTLLIVVASSIGLSTPGFYTRETLNWQAQSIGQDWVNLLLIAPALLISSFFAYRGKPRTTGIWGGVVMYSTYTFVLYCFDIHFNSLFIVYCACLGLSFYAFAYFLLARRWPARPRDAGNKSFARLLGLYFMLLSVAFYALWLLEVVPGILENRVPESITDTGLFTNGVHVLDLSVVLPAIFVAGLLLWQSRSLGFMLAPVMLTFFILMDITIGVLAVVMKMKGIESSLILMGVMGMLALISFTFLVLFLRNIRTVMD